MIGLKNIISIDYQCTACGSIVNIMRGSGSFKQQEDYCWCPGAVMIVKSHSNVNSSNNIPVGNAKPKKFALGKVTRPKMRKKK